MTHEEAFAYYEKEVKAWMNAMGLHEWHPQFSLVARDDIYSEVYVQWYDRLADFRFAMDPQQKYTEEATRSHALHEVLELLFVDIRRAHVMCKDEETLDKTYDTEVHKIIHRLAPLLLQEDEQ